MNSVFAHIQCLIEESSTGVLCLVVSTSGSTPRKAGAKMLLKEDGRIVGTIGGGTIELRVKEVATSLLGRSEPLLKTFDLAQDLDMHCGGTMTVYFEPIGSADRLVIFGAGHVGGALARLAHSFGFRILMVDPRTDLPFSDFPPGTQWIHKPYLEAIPTIKPDACTYAVVMTPQHHTDEEVTAHLAAQPIGYLGMIGSKRKVALASKRFAVEFGLSPQQIEHIDMPVGIPLSVETPDEIALSITARLVDIRNRNRKAGQNLVTDPK